MRPNDDAGLSQAEVDEEFSTRLQRLRAAMERWDLDALIAYSTTSIQANVRYLTDYSALLAGLQGRADGSEHIRLVCVPRALGGGAGTDDRSVVGRRTGP